MKSNDESYSKIRNKNKKKNINKINIKEYNK
jgi:hypothetical protein